VAAQPNVNPGAIRNAIRWGLLLAAIGTVGFRLPQLVHDFREWREALKFGDSSTSDGWKAIFWVNSAGALIVLAIGVALFYALRPPEKAQQ
jgi:hypothetical protein